MFDSHNVSMFNRRGKLYVQFYIDGRLKQRSTRLDDTPQNRKLVQNEVIPQLILKLKSGEFDSSKKPKPFEWYGDKWLRQKEHLKSYMEWHNIYLHQLLPVFGKKRVDEIGRGDVKAFVDARLEQVSPKRVRTLLNCIKAILDIAIEYEHIATNPATLIKLPAHKPRRVMEPFTREEVEVLLDKAEGWFKNYLAFAFYTGARHGELLALTWGDVDLDTMTISITKRIKKGEIDSPKTRSSIRRVPIFRPLVPYIESQMKLSRKTLSMSVFYNPYTRRQFIDTKKLSRFWYALLDSVGMKRRAFYNTHHTFVTQMIRAGVPILDVSQMVGHKTIEETIRTYAKFLPEEHLKITRDFDPFFDNSTDNGIIMPKYSAR